jgi:23S rRNA (uridine2552-2'-O)-methyltransferase
VYQRKDRFYRRAREQGYRSRAAYKLVELARRYRLIEPGDTVVDLGAWPGSWLQVARELATARGTVVGVDLRPLEAVVAGAEFVAGDVRDPQVRGRVLELAGGRADVVLSDLAPKLTGIRDRDEAAVEELAAVAMDFACDALREGGRLVMKTFTVPQNTLWLARLRPLFTAVKLTRPEASRAGSSELYLIATGFRGSR